jgi:hypothetical protein
MSCLALSSRLVLMALGISLLVSGCASQTDDSNSRAIEPTPRNSITETLGSHDSKLTRVKNFSLVNPSEVLTFTCELIVAKPKEVTPYCADFGISIADIEWKIWRATGAMGTGVHFANDCKPNCAEGKVSQVPVLINLEGLFSDGQRYFLRYLTFAETVDLPQSEKIADTWDLAEFYLEKFNLGEDS